MADSQYLPFATGLGANVMTHVAYVADPRRLVGQVAGPMDPQIENTALRQGAFVGAGIGRYIVDQLGVDLPDDFDFEGLISKLVDAMKQQMITAGKVIRPGTIAVYAGLDTPAGYTSCDGTERSRTAFAALFAAIGTRFGAGDGATTFNLPDLRGRVLAGVDVDHLRITADWAGAIGGAGGLEWHALFTFENPPHVHVLHEDPHVHTMPNLQGGFGGPYYEAVDNVNNHRFEYHKGLLYVVPPPPYQISPGHMFDQNGYPPGLPRGMVYDVPDGDRQNTAGVAIPAVVLQDAGASAAHNNVAPTMALKWLIKT